MLVAAPGGSDDTTSSEENTNKSSAATTTEPVKKRAETWVKEKTGTLIILRHFIASLFNTSKSNKHLWEQISLKMIAKAMLFYKEVEENIRDRNKSSKLLEQRGDLGTCWSFGGRRHSGAGASAVGAVTGVVAAVVGAVTRDGGDEIGIAARHQTTDSE
ncbi:hypothetical protein L1987_78830 [Smallanthus sonchifolius]|uniref:Uncharacterized protein n=1 Tax=Smallanthus sonchifolius TaxID=185202 RepID=A0ACB8ZE09_9ASTR|nr:hypothetical protein L1987_78830 [Smallanthus sonchifolius]